ncbi:MAG: hypothetical protein ABIR32_00430 [Ilumatobacteraceae bacterium]
MTVEPVGRINATASDQQRSDTVALVEHINPYRGFAVPNAQQLGVDTIACRTTSPVATVRRRLDKGEP